MSDDETPSDSSDTNAGGMKPMPRYQPAPPLGAESLLQSGAPVNLRVALVDDLPPKQQRWTILIRLILLIPQVIVLLFILIGAFLVTIVAWFIALVIGRVPESIASYQRLTLRWSTRVNAYSYLMTDLYPPFHGDDDEDFPIGVEIPVATSLNRLAVLFRIVIVFPAYLLGIFIGAGFGVFVFFYWIAALILGRLPDPVYRGAATLVRYQARLSAYLFMLTPEYPWGWKGDDSTDVRATTTSSHAGESSDYWGAVTSTSATTMPTERSRFDFHLIGWSLSWIWIWIVVGVVQQVLTRR